MSLVVRDSYGNMTYRTEVAANGVDLVVRNMSTGLVDYRIENAAL